MKEKLRKIYEIQKELTLLNGIVGTLVWDQKTNMPKDAVNDRAEQLAYIEKEHHKLLTSKELKEDVHYLMNKKLSTKDKLVVERLNKIITKSEKLPSSFVHEMSETRHKALSAWENAKKKDDFSLFEPYLKKIVELKQKEARYIGLEGHPYNSLLDSFEEGMTTERLIILFKRLKKGLVPLLQEIKQKKEIIKLGGIYSIETQKIVAKEVADLIKFPFNKGNLGTSLHGFTAMLSSEDVRITTQFDENVPLFSIGATIHECGHAFYDLGLPREYKNTVLYECASVGLHESQSRFWENMIVKRMSFVKHVYKIFKKYYPKQMKNVSVDKLYTFWNQVKDSMIRVYSDEVSYCLHIIMRFEIEVGLIEGTIKVKDLPKVWNQKMREYLGLSPRNYKEGVLQDTHWGMGYFGYFPTYAIGSIYAAQIYRQIEKELGDIDTIIEKKQFEKILHWLNKHIHKYSNTISADDIIKKCCKSGLDPDVFLDYLTRKYGLRLLSVAKSIG